MERETFVYQAIYYFKTLYEAYFILRQYGIYIFITKRSSIYV